MKDEEISAEALCKLADEYQLGAEEMVKKCLNDAKNSAQYQGRKTAKRVFTSKAVSEAELSSVKSQLEARGFSVTTSRNDEHVSIELNFDVCD